MSPFATLLKREWLEAKLPYFWLPLGTLAALMLFGLVAVLISGNADFQLEVTTDGGDARWLFVDTWSEEQLQDRLLAFRGYVFSPFYLTYFIATLFVLLGALYDDRKDRSVLFWKSLPVSDLETVASKLVLALWIAPLLMIACAVLAQLFLLGAGTAYLAVNDLGDAGRIWSQSGMLEGALMLLLGMLIQGLWVLPLAAYLLLVSATVPKLPLLWALIGPVVPVIAERLMFGTSYLASGIARHLEPAALPYMSGDEDRIMPVVTNISGQLELLIHPDLWIGVLLGIVLLYGAAWMRGLKNEL